MINLTMASAKLKCDVFENLPCNTVFRFRKQAGSKYHKVIIIDEANLSAVFHMYKSFTIWVLDNITTEVLTEEIGKILDQLSRISQLQKVIFIFACGYSSLLSRKSMANTNSISSNCKDCYFYLLNESPENITQQMQLVRSLIMVNSPQCYFLPVALPPFSLELHLLQVKGDHQKCCPQFVKSLSTLTSLEISQMQKNLDLLVAEYNKQVSFHCLNVKLPVIDWSKIYLTTNRLTERQSIIMQKINSMICDFIHSIYQEECAKELKHIQKALQDEDVVIKEEQTEEFDVDTSVPHDCNENSLAAMEISQPIPGSENITDVRDLSLLEVNIDANNQEMLVSQSPSGVNSMVTCVESSALSKLDEEKKIDSRASELLDSNAALSGSLLCSPAKSRASLVESRLKSIICGDNLVASPLNKMKAKKRLDIISNEDDVVQLEPSSSRGSCNAVPAEPKLPEEEVQVIARGSRSRRSSSVLVINDGNSLQNDVEILSPVKTGNNVASNSKNINEVKKVTIRERKMKRRSRRNNVLKSCQDLVILDDSSVISDSSIMSLSTPSILDAARDDEVSCTSSDYASCDEITDVLCVKVTGRDNKAPLLRPEVECLQLSKKQVSPPRCKTRDNIASPSICNTAASSSSSNTTSVINLPLGDEPPTENVPLVACESLNKNKGSKMDRKKTGPEQITIQNKEANQIIPLQLEIKIKEEPDAAHPTNGCDVSIFKRTEESGNVLRVLITEDRFFNLADLLSDQNCKNYMHLSCRGGLIWRYIKPILNAVRETMDLKMNKNKHLLIAVCLGSEDIVNSLKLPEYKKHAPFIHYGKITHGVAQKVSNSLMALKGRILQLYPRARIIFFKIPAFSKEGMLKKIIEMTNNRIRDINFRDKSVSVCLSHDCPYKTHSMGHQYVLTERFIESWLKVCQWYLKVLEDSVENTCTSGDHVEKVSLKRKRRSLQEIPAVKHTRRKLRNKDYINTHTNIVCSTAGGRANLNQVSDQATDSISEVDVERATVDDESDETVLFSDSDTETNSVFDQDLNDQITTMVMLLGSANESNPIVRLNFNKNFLSTNVCALIAVGRITNDRAHEKRLLEIACTLKESETSSPVPPHLNAQQKKSIILGIGKAVDYLDDATLSQAANDLLYTSVLSLKRVYV
ncbi:uncharacterized protein LOC108679818 [Hyalella azteca]|uniref:Uncharacterized protein LOC108679818 n=1 Tax=Hyalella azteca TaxID=294128 RepID=A0A8B7PDF7_HYAAZ|nr:uncharacterized protein LOC108679818 [Hyalella azteca]